MLQKNTAIVTFILSFALSLGLQSLHAQNLVDKSTLLTGITNLNSSVFSRSPLLKHPIQDKEILDELLADTALYVAKNSSNDKTIATSLALVTKESENIIKTSEYLYVAQKASVRNLSLERALFSAYVKSMANLNSAKKQLRSETYLASGKRSSREILLALIDELLKTTQQAYKVYEDQEKQADKMSQDQDYVITFLSAAQGKIFEVAKVFKTPSDVDEKNEKMQYYNQWNEAIRLVEKYVAYNNKPVSKNLNAYLIELKNLADSLINTTKFINKSVFAKEGIISGSENDRTMVNAYSGIDKQAKAIAQKLRAPEFAKNTNWRNVRAVLSAFALIIEATAEKMPTAFTRELNKRNS